MCTEGPDGAAEHQDVLLPFGHCETWQNLHVLMVAESQEETDPTHF